MKPNGTPSFVRLAGTVSPAEVRTETFDGREVLVIPVVALVGDVIVTGMTSAGPEFIPAHVLAAMPDAWNGRPVVVAHPQDGRGSANTPTLWQHSTFGQCWNTTFEDNRLRMEIWLDPVKAETVGADALEVLALAQSGQMFEVSTGSWAWLVPKVGTHGGQRYEFEWASTIPDHLAVGLQSQGGKGACSIFDGCGGMRTMAQPDEVSEQPVETAEPIVEPAVAANGGCRCHETQPVAASHENAHPDEPAEGQAHQGKGATAMSKVAELAGRLIANAAAPFTDADRAHLEALSEEQLEAMDKSFTPPAEPEKPAEPKPEDKDGEGADKGKGTPLTPPVDTVQLSRSEYNTIVGLANREAQRDKAVRAALTTALLAHPVKVFTEAQLATKSADDLEQLCALAGIDLAPTAALDYSRPIALATDQPIDRTPPDPWKVGALAAQLGHKPTVQ